MRSTRCCEALAPRRRFSNEPCRINNEQHMATIDRQDGEARRCFSAVRPEDATRRG